MSNLPANWETPETPQREEESGRRRSVGPILIVMGVTFALLVGSVLGSFATCGFMESKSNPAFQFFLACTLFFIGIFVMSAAWLAVSLIIRLFQYIKDARVQ